MFQYNSESKNQFRFRCTIFNIIDFIYYVYLFIYLLCQLLAIIKEDFMKLTLFLFILNYPYNLNQLILKMFTCG